MASEPSAQSRVMFQSADKTEEPAHRKLGKLTVKYNRKDLQRRLDIEEWIDGQLHLLFDCEVGQGRVCVGTHPGAGCPEDEARGRSKGDTDLYLKEGEGGGVSVPNPEDWKASSFAS